MKCNVEDRTIKYLFLFFVFLTNAFLGRNRAGYPADCFLVNDNPLAVVGMDVHGFSIINDSRLKIETIVDGLAA